MKLIGALLILMFYTVYFAKMILQRRKGIKTDQIAKGKRHNKTFYIELVMKIATYSVVAVEAASIAFVNTEWSPAFIIGAIIGLVGDAVFAISVYTMKDSWRAGIAENDETELVSSGIYKISRNPAFLGFDLLYIGILIMFFNCVLLVFTLFAMLMLHLQILQEEKYLISVFGEDYAKYKARVFRYIGRQL